MPRTGSSWIAVAVASSSVAHAARGPSSLAAKLIAGHGAEGERREPGRDALVLPGSRTDCGMAGTPAGYLETLGNPGPG